ncbi:MAG TPA: type II secretion system protein [Gaiellaceae bacterium]
MSARDRHHRTSAERTAASEAGFTLIELLITVVVLGILIAIAVPTFLGFQAKAADASAKENIRIAVPAARAFADDNVGAKGDADNKKNTTGYKGMTVALLRAKYDPGLSPTLKVVSSKTNATQFCLADTVRSRSWSLLGPAQPTFHKNAKCN